MPEHLYIEPRGNEKVVVTYNKSCEWSRLGGISSQVMGLNLIFGNWEQKIAKGWFVDSSEHRNDSRGARIPGEAFRADAADSCAVP